MSYWISANSEEEKGITLIMSKVMADKNKTTSEDPTKQLLHFVSNASREIKIFLDKVENEDSDVKAEECPKSPRSPKRPKTPRTPVPSPHSPIPSPTPSPMSMCDQEVPQMSPEPSMEYLHPQIQRKRRLEMYPDESARYCKRTRYASTGEFDEYNNSCRFGKRNFLTVPSRQYASQSVPSSTSSSIRKDCMFNENNSDFRCQRLYSNMYDLQNGWPNGYNGMNNFINYNSIPTNNHLQSEPSPDFADLVSWMVAEDFLDVETLSSLLAAH